MVESPASSNFNHIQLDLSSIVPTILYDCLKYIIPDQINIFMLYGVE